MIKLTIGYLSILKKRKFHLQNIKVSCLFEASEAVGFDVVFLLGYTTILPKTFLAQNDLTLVVHESALPKGKGFAPVQWQLLEGYSEITVSLIEAVEKCDSGDIFHQLKIAFDGTELYDEIREKQAIATIDIISEFLNSYPNVSRSKQIGEESFYPKKNLG